MLMPRRAPAKAINILKRLEKAKAHGRYVSPVAMARVHAALGNKQQAIESVEEACARKDMFVSWLKEDSRIDPVRPMCRFQSILTKVGI